LEQDNWVKDKDYGNQTSSEKANNLNPVFEETFTFTIPTLENMVLTCKVMDADFGSRDDKVGSCKIKLQDLGLSMSPKQIERVIDRNLIAKNGMIHLTLSYTDWNKISNYKCLW